jgi:hypothetical protein
MYSMKKSFLIASLVATVAVAGTVAFAFAQTQNQNGSGDHGEKGDHGNGGQKMMITISPSGKAMIRGTLLSGGSMVIGSTTASTTNPGTITVKSWGITFTITTAGADLSLFKNGDFVGVIGTIDPTTQIITAKVIRDWSIVPTNGKLKKQKQNENDHATGTPEMGHGNDQGRGQQ